MLEFRRSLNIKILISKFVLSRSRWTHVHPRRIINAVSLDQHNQCSAEIEDARRQQGKDIPRTWHRVDKEQKSVIQRSSQKTEMVPIRRIPPEVLSLFFHFRKTHRSCGIHRISQTSSYYTSPGLLVVENHYTGHSRSMDGPSDLHAFQHSTPGTSRSSPIRGVGHSGVFAVIRRLQLYRTPSFLLHNPLAP